MELAMIGLGKMGGNMALRLARGGHRVVAFDRSAGKKPSFEKEGVEIVGSLKEISTALEQPRVVWLMIPAGVVGNVIEELAPFLDVGDIIVDGGNSNYRDSLARAEMLAERGVEFVDCGVSGGIWGLDLGYNLMAGGKPEAFAAIEPALKTLAQEDGYLHAGPVGAGHFVKMVHNGIEYAQMQAIAEGFEIMQAKEAFNLDLAALADLWMNGSVIRSWLLELAGSALSKDPDLSEIAGYVSDSGEGRWTVFESIDLDVPAPTITHALQMRFRSRQDESFAAKMLAALRNEFGGHAIKKAE
jgi:6-phosphogluconate dehydrogenase